MARALAVAPRLIGLIGIVAAVALAAGLRALAVSELPIDFDEDDYLRAGQQYAQAIQAADLDTLTALNYRTEHPPLAKVAYGIALAGLPAAPEIPDRPTSAPPATSLPQPHLTVARSVAGLFGTLEVLAVALVSPLGALLLATHTWSVKYTSQVMLEALPALLSVLAVVAWVGARRTSRPRLRQVLIAVAALLVGATAAGKYLYAVAGLAILADWWLHPLAGRPRRLRPLVLWCLLVMAAFVAVNPYLWPDPIGRMQASIGYFFGYTGAIEVEQANFPLWQPLVWLTGAVPFHPGIVPPVLDLGPVGSVPLALDMLIAAFAAFGLRPTWRREPVWVLWLGLGLAVLLIWPTKWPQYIVTVGAPLSVVAANGIRATLGERLLGLRAAIAARRSRPAAETGDGAEVERGPFGGWRRVVPWLVPGFVALTVLVLFPLLYQAAMSTTDFSATSIRDGLQGGVWREAAGGVTGQIAPIEDFDARANQVRYAGLGWFGLIAAGVFSDVLVVTVLWMVLAVGCQLVLGVAVAMVLRRRGVRARWLWRALFILPWAIPEFVGALAWVNILHPDYGWLALAGWSIPWMAEPDVALLVLLVAATWMGWPVLFLAATAGLRTIPVEVEEASAIDGASSWRTFRDVTLPLLLPILVPIVLLRAIVAFNQFYLFWAMNPPFPVYTVPAVSYFIFNPSFEGQFGLSAALNLSSLLLLGFLVLRFNRLTRQAVAVRDAR